MDNGLSSSGDSAPTPAKVPDFSRTKKENKILKIFIPILIILVIAAGVVATLFLTGVIGGNGTNNEDDIDRDVKDQDRISVIDDELGVLFGKSVENSEIIINSSNYDDVYLWRSLDLTEEQKIYRILNSLEESQKTELSITQREEAISVWTENGGLPESLNLDEVVAYPGDVVNEKYKKIFGVNAYRAPMESQRVQYLSTYDIYLKTPSKEVPTTNERHYYIGRYFENGNRVYVYMYGGLYNTDTRTSHCDVFTPEKTDVEVCETVAADQTFSINEKNSGNYLLRMLTFYLDKNNNLFYLGSNSPIIKWGLDPDAEE